jgi:large subunit ribosomal protein L21
VKVYAVVETGGKQYKVQVGETVDVEWLDVNVGSQVELDRVLLVAEESNIRVGQPVLADAKVSATVLRHGMARKVIIFRYRPKQRYRRKIGHRQFFTRLRIDEIKA